MNTRPHFVLVGGFLGAGKTTSIARFARHLGDQGLRTALIANDQGHELVDTTVLRAGGIQTAEIGGGCFCCRFDALIGATRAMGAGVTPDVFLAEAVGSCTDLIATVAYPLRRLHREQFTIAPLSVLVDPVRARRMLEGGDAAGFSPEVCYVFEKQLEEAELIVVTKSDTISPVEIEALRAMLARRFPSAEFFSISARSGSGLDAWFQRMLFGEQALQPTMSMDYDRYAEGEARLGWCDASAEVAGDSDFDADALLLRLAVGLQEQLRAQHVPIAHLKLSLRPGGRDGGLASVNVVRNDAVPEWGHRWHGGMRSGRLQLNLRAEASPERLAAAVRGTLCDTARSAGVRIEQLATDSFQPGRPMPTHRDVYPAGTAE